MAAAADTKQSVYHDTDEQPGLEVADSTNKLKGFYGPGAPDGIEVAPNQASHPGGKEVVPGSSPPLERRSSLNQPEAWHLPHQQQQQPLIDDEKGAAAGAGQDYDLKKEERWTRRRYCGMRGKWLVILVAVILVVVIAAVVGGVLGTVLPSHGSSQDRSSGSSGTVGDGSGSGSSSGSSSQAVTGSRVAHSQSGLAATFLGKNDTTLLTYYQDESNRIIENVYIDGAWSSDTSSAAAIVAEAASGSPLSAISYEYNGTTWRQVFFVGNDTAVWSTKATADGAWEPAGKLVIQPTDNTANITTTHVAQGPALAACYGYDSLEAIRVYYGDTEGYIQELGHYFNESVWYAFNQFTQSDSSSGVGCDFYSNSSDTGDLGAIMNVYYRNTSSLELQQSWWSFRTNAGWNSGPTGDGISIGSGTPISVSDGSGKEEYVFFQSSNGTVTRGSIDATLSDFGTFDDLGSAISGGRLASAYFDGGTVYLFQNSTEDTTIWLSNWALDGTLATSQRLPGTGQD